MNKGGLGVRYFALSKCNTCVQNVCQWLGSGGQDTADFVEYHSPFEKGGQGVLVLVLTISPANSPFIPLFQRGKCSASQAFFT
jgi:hypothetical protein